MRKVIVIESIKGEGNFVQRAGYEVQQQLGQWLRENNIYFPEQPIDVICGFRLQDDNKILPKLPHFSQLAKELGRRGGLVTKKKGRDYYKRIGKLGLAKRYKKQIPLEEKETNQ